MMASSTPRGYIVSIIPSQLADAIAWLQEQGDQLPIEVNRLVRALQQAVERQATA